MKLETIKSYLQIILAATFGLALVWGFFMKLIPAEAFTAIAGSIIGYGASERKSSKEMESTLLAVKAASQKDGEKV